VTSPLAMMKLAAVLACCAIRAAIGSPPSRQLQSTPPKPPHPLPTGRSIPSAFSELDGLSENELDGLTSSMLKTTKYKPQSSSMLKNTKFNYTSSLARKNIPPLSSLTSLRNSLKTKTTSKSMDDEIDLEEIMAGHTPPKSHSMHTGRTKSQSSTMHIPTQASMARRTIPAHALAQRSPPHPPGHHTPAKLLPGASRPFYVNGSKPKLFHSFSVNGSKPKLLRANATKRTSTTKKGVPPPPRSKGNRRSKFPIFVVIGCLVVLLLGTLGFIMYKIS